MHVDPVLFVLVVVILCTYCVVCDDVMVAQCEDSVGCVFAHLYTLVDDLECH